jgi:geranylgeranyl pyrophosphate synthase
MIPLLQPSIDGLREFLLSKNCFFLWNDSSVEKKVREYISSGKLIRGGLLVALLFKTNPDDAYILGSALELSQSAFLIQDDIMDHDELRRGKPSLHIQLSETCNKETGTNLALCISDYLFFQSQELLVSISDHSARAALSTYWNKQFMRVCIGQYDDNYLASKPIIPSSELLRELYANKTSSYSFCIPLFTSALFSSASDKVRTILEKIGNDLGVLFQLSDDMLNIYGNSETSGKPTLSDIREKKKTLLVSLAFEASDIAQQKILREYYCNPTSADMSFVLAVFLSSDIKQLSDKSKNTLRLSIQSKLSDSTIPKNIASTILPLLDFIDTRTV